MTVKALSSYPLIAEGGESKIYQYDNTRVLRVPQRPRYFDRIRYEFEVYKAVQDKTSVPRVYEILTCDDTPCLLMEKIDGRDLFTSLQSGLHRIVGIPRKLALLHTELLRVPAGETFETNHAKAQYCIGHSDLLSAEVKSRLFELLSTLDGGTTLCHGDFHPGNIIHSGAKDFIIDWSSATVGSPLFDIAHTYLLLMNTPRLGGVSDKLYRLQRRATRYIGRRYLKRICKMNKFTPGEFFPYLLVKAAERTFYGRESEKQWLCTFVTNTLGTQRIDVLHLEDYGLPKS